MFGSSRERIRWRVRVGLPDGRIRRREMRGLGMGLVLSLCTLAVQGTVPGVAFAASPATANLSANLSTPNRFDPTTRAASVKPAPAAKPMRAPASQRGADHHHAAPMVQAAMQPATVALDPSKPGHIASSDSALELDVPAGAVSAADVSAAGGQMSLMVRRVLPASGGSAGGSGHFTFGTFLVQVLDSRGQLAKQGLRLPVGLKLHYGAHGSALDLSHATAVVNPPLPAWFDPDPAAAGVAGTPAAGPATSMPSTGLAAGAPLGVARTPASSRKLGPTSTQKLTVNAGAQTLSMGALTVAAAAAVTFNSSVPVATFGAPDLFETNPSAGALVLRQPLALPAGPGGLTPPLALDYDSASVSDQHNVQGAASWVGEGWHLSLGAISWAERDVAMGCSVNCPTPAWNDVWQLVDGFGTKAELIPPNFNVSTYNDDFNGTAITPSPNTWHTAPETHTKVISYTGPNALPGQAAIPPCFRVFLPSGIMEEFGCTPDSLQFYPEPIGLNAGLDYISSWLPDLITDPRGNQVHITYQTDTETGFGGISYPRDAVMATVEYDSPDCHNAQAACTGAAWAPLMRVSFAASHSVAHVSGSACAASGNQRCDDPVDLSAGGGVTAPTVESTFVLNDALVQVRSSGSAAWNTLRDYQLAYDQSPPTTITDPFGGTAESTAGRLNLTRLTELGADGTTALPSRSFGYSRQTQYYEDPVYPPLPATNCGPSWNAGQTFGLGCNLWSQSYEGNSYYLSSASNGMGLAQTFSWQNARDNSGPGGVPPGSSLLDPFACNGSNQSISPCDVADYQAWSRIVLTQQTESVVRQSQAGQGGAQTSTPVTGTYSYAYVMAAADSYWGDMFDYDVLDFYNERFMGFATATVTKPDGSSEVHHYPQTLGVGVFNPNDPIFTGMCTPAPTNPTPCPTSPWWNPANADHGREIELDRLNTDGSLAQVVTTQYQTLCPSSGVTGDMAGQLISELDIGNSVALCDIAPSQVDTYRIDGGSQASAPHLTTSNAYDALGRVTSKSQTSNDGGGPGSPTTIVRKAAYGWNDSVTATPTSATGTYLIDFPAFGDVEDTAGSRYQCRYASYDGQANTQGQTPALTLGELTRSDVYTGCGSAANGFAPSGQISVTHTYDALGNLLTTDDADALGGNSAHLGCTVGTGTFSSCAAFDGTFGTLPTSLTNALNQTTTTGYQAPLAGTPTGGFGLWPVSATDANGQTTMFGYDALGRPTGQTLPGEAAGLSTLGMAYTFWCSGTNAQAPCVEVDKTKRLNSTTTVTSRSFYDGLGHLVEARTAAPGGQDVVSYSFYDASRRLAFQSVPYFVSAYTGAPGAAAYSIPDSSQAGITYTYDGLDRLKSTTDALSHTSSTSYSMACNAAGTGDAACYEQTLTVDADGHQGGALVDAMGRTAYEQRYTGSTATTHAVYATTKYTRDFAGDLTQVLQPDGATRTTVLYDMAGRKTGMTDPDRGTETYTYDPSGNLVQSVDARGAAGTVFAGYDGLNRPLWHNTANSPTGAFHTYSYDSTLGGSAGVGRLTGETFSGGTGSPLSGSYGFTYDARGQQTSKTVTVGTASYPLQFTYDDAGNVLTRRYPDGETVSNAYTGQGWLSGVNTQQGTTTTTLLSGAAYTGVGGAFGDITGAALDGTAYRYSASDDLLGRATDLKVTNGTGTATLFDQARTFDAMGNVATASTTLPGGTDNQAFCYDEQNRLTWAGSTGTAPCTGTAVPAGTLTAAQYTQSFTYDTLGRMATGPLGSYSYGSGAHVHAATAVGSGYTASYDAAGDMTCRAPTTASTCAGASPTGAQLAYDPEGQLTSWQSAPSSPSSTVAYLYDCQGQRVALQVTQAGATTTTVYVGGLEEVTTSGATTTTKTYYYAGGRRIAMAVNGTVSYLASDGLGSTNVVLNAGGSAVASQLFAPYGGLRYANGTMPTTYGFTGQRGDAATGLDYYRARYYDPVAGQFSSADTAVPGGGYNLWGLSRYAYTRGNPTSRTDPTGHDDFDAAGLDFENQVDFNDTAGLDFENQVDFNDTAGLDFENQVDFNDTAGLDFENQVDFNDTAGLDFENQVDFNDTAGLDFENQVDFNDAAGLDFENSNTDQQPVSEGGSSYLQKVGEALGNADGPMLTPEQQAEVGKAISDAAKAISDWWNTPRSLPNPQFASGIADTAVAAGALYLTGSAAYTAYNATTWLNTAAGAPGFLTGASNALGAGFGAGAVGINAYLNFSAAFSQPMVTMSPAEWVSAAFWDSFRPPTQ
jgi:RHS repeat-associated protein